jgi:hypothetical protein
LVTTVTDILNGSDRLYLRQALRAFSHCRGGFSIRNKLESGFGLKRE